MQATTVSEPRKRSRSRRPSFKLTQKQRARIVAKSCGACVYCGSDELRYAEAHEIDHFVPASRGGSNAHSNLVAACRFCNRDKGDMLIDEYRAYIETQQRAPCLFDYENAGYGPALGLTTDDEIDRLLRRCEAYGDRIEWGRVQ